MLNKKQKRDRVLIKAQVNYIRELIGNGVELVYKPGHFGRGRLLYWRHLGKWKWHVRRYKYVVLGENFYNYNVSKFIKKFNPKCKVVLFFWNKLLNYNYTEYIKDPNLDDIYTFDEEEAKKYNFKFAGTFYSKRVKLPENKVVKDVLFLGRGKDREKEIKDLESLLKKLKIKTDFHIINDEKDYIDYKDYLEMISKSKAILDYSAYNQRGLTLRVMESLFFGKKLITANKHIKEYDFYDKNNIFILFEDDITKLNKFLKTPVKPVDPKILDYYDFDNWINRFE